MIAKTQCAKPQPWGGGFLSSRYLGLRAVALVLLFGAAHLAGLRESTTFLTGTAAASGASLQSSAYAGGLYILLYLGFVVLAPILALAAALLYFWERRDRRVSLPSATKAQPTATEPPISHEPL